LPWEMKPYESGTFIRRCRSSSPTTNGSSVYRRHWRRSQKRKPERVEALANESFKSLEAFLEDVKKTDIDHTLSTKLQALLPEYQRLYSQTLEGAECDNTEGKCADETTLGSPQVSRTPVYVSSPISSHRTLEESLCNEKKSEDARHAPGIHPLAYESCLTKRGEMLREVKRLNAEFVSISPQRINEHFKWTVAGNDCDKKGPPALCVRRSSGSKNSASTTSLKKACSVPSSPTVLSSPIVKNLDLRSIPCLPLWCSSTTSDDTKIAVGNLDRSGSQVSQDSQVEHCFKIALSQLREESAEPRPRGTRSYPTSPRKMLRSVSPAQTQKQLEKVICSTKKEEDAKHTPGLHPLAYESSLSPRFLMLREHQHEVNPELVPATYKTEKQFKGSLCDAKQEEDKFAQQAPRPEPMKAVLADLPGFKNLWALSSNSGRPSPLDSGMASLASPRRRASPPKRRVRRISNP